MEFNNRLLLKVLELALAIAAIVLAETIGNLSTHNMLVCGTLGGFVIVCGVILIGFIINSPIDRRLNGLVSIVGAALFLTSGALVINEWRDGKLLYSNDTKNKALAAGSLMIIDGVVFLLDTLCIFRN